MLSEKEIEELPTAYMGDIKATFDNKAGLYLPNYKAILDNESDHCHAVVSKRYQITQHADLIRTVQDVLLKMGGDYPLCRSRYDVWADGGRMEARYTFYNQKIDIDGNPISPTLVVRNSYDLSCGRQITCGAFRWICSNGLYVGVKGMKTNAIHCIGADVKITPEIIQQALLNLPILANAYRRWHGIAVPYEEQVEIIELVGFSEKDKAAVCDLKEVGSKFIINQQLTLTRWQLYNILYQYTTHGEMSQNKRYNLQQKIASLPVFDLTK